MKMRGNRLKSLLLGLSFLSDYSSAFRMIKAYAEGRDTAVPYRSLLKIVIAIIYIFFFMDIIPDFIPLAGWLDDFAVSAWVLHSLRKDIGQFKRWEMQAN